MLVAPTAVRSEPCLIPTWSGTPATARTSTKAGSPDTSPAAGPGRDPGGGISFLDAAADGTALARAYLVTREQFADVAAQEMHREPGADLDLVHVLANRSHTYGPGRYETIHLVGELDGAPLLTFTSADTDQAASNAPSGAYLATIVRGLRATHALDDQAATDYLLGCRGMETWAPEEVRRLVAASR